MADIKPVVLVVDDEPSIRESFSLILSKEFKVITASTGEAALKHVIDERVDLVYLDIRMPGLSGIEALKRLKEIDKGLDVIMVTAVNDVGSATMAVKLGAKDYIVKPFDVEDIINRTRSMVIKTQAKKINPYDYDIEELIGNSRQMIKIKNDLENTAKKGDSVLIMGEKGTEANIIAGIIARETGKPIRTLEISVDFKDHMLFGRGKGSFAEIFSKETGAIEDAGGGILFVRNIEMLSHDAQLKLADVLTSKQISREGSTSKITIDVRIISETSVNLKEFAEEGLFDKGLCTILSNAVIELPPLRERTGDLPLLISHLLDRFEGIYNKNVIFNVGAMEILTNHPWPGNRAELANTIERIVLSSDKAEIGPDDLPIDILIGAPVTDSGLLTLDHISGILEDQYIDHVYRRSGRNKEKAANLLGIQLKALESKLGPSF